MIEQKILIRPERPAYQSWQLWARAELQLERPLPSAASEMPAKVRLTLAGLSPLEWMLLKESRFLEAVLNDTKVSYALSRRGKQGFVAKRA